MNKNGLIKQQNMNFNGYILSEKGEVKKEVQNVFRPFASGIAYIGIPEKNFTIAHICSVAIIFHANNTPECRLKVGR